MPGRIPATARGTEMDLCCPFHKGGLESHPSFRVNVVTGLSWCNVCKEGWNLKSLLIALGLSREEAEAEVDGAELSDPNLTEVEIEYLPNVLLSAYRKCPVGMLRAGFSKEVLQDYEIGWDRINKRIVFPIRDHIGRLVALQGRNTVGKDLRYVTYKEELKEVVGHELMHVKVHHFLWGLERLYATGFYGGLDYLVLVEGIKKALWLKQFGWDNVVSLNGSYMSDEQQKLISRLNIDKLVLMLDGDSAGKLGIARIAGVFGGIIPLAIPAYPEGKTQPDDLSVDELDEMLSAEGRRWQTWETLN